VILDTLHSFIGPDGDENGPDMARMVNAAKSIRDATNATTAYIHHEGKTPNMGGRGHSSLFADLDFVVRVSGKSNPHHAVVNKLREGASDHAAHFEFDIVPVEAVKSFAVRQVTLREVVSVAPVVSERERVLVELARDPRPSDRVIATKTGASRSMVQRMRL